MRSAQVGCTFAHAILNHHRPSVMAYSMKTPTVLADVEIVQQRLEEAFHEPAFHAVMLVFPEVGIVDHLVPALNLLLQHDSWSWCESKGDVADTAGGVSRFAFGMRWTMPDHDTAFALGFGPYGFLPPTRLAPYTTITVPVCERGTKRMEDPDEDPSHRHLCDMLNEELAAEWAAKERGTTELKKQLIDDHEKRAAKAKVTFALPDSVRATLAPPEAGA